MPRKRKKAIEKGIRPWKSGWQAYIEIRGKTYAQSFPLCTPVPTMRTWRTEQRDKFGGGDPAAHGSFGADVVEYLTRITALPTYDQKAAHLELWARALGRDRPRQTITDTEVDMVLQDWLGQLAPATVRKRRTSLQSFFKKLDGKNGKNPVRGSTIPRSPEPEARGLDYVTVANILAAMPMYRDTKDGAPKLLSLAKLRATVIAYTGLPPGMLADVKANDLQLTVGTVRVRPRRKGKGVGAHTLPLLAEGLAAFKAFHDADAYGTFAIESLNRSFKRAAARAGLDPETVHLYDLRHSFGTALYEVTKDLATVGRFLGHAEGSPITARYAKGANKNVDVAAASALSAAISEQRRLSLKPAPAARARGARQQRSA